MSEDATTTRRTSSELFTAKTLLWVVAAGVIGFALFIILATYAPDFRQMSNVPVPATVQSKGGNGFAGLERWLEAHDYKVIRSDDANVITTTVPIRARRVRNGPARVIAGSAPLMIVTLEVDTPEERIQEIVNSRRGMPTLFILPKYFVVKKKNAKDGWVEKATILPPGLSTDHLRTIQKAYGLVHNDKGISDPDPNNTSPDARRLFVSKDEIIQTKHPWRTSYAGFPIVYTVSRDDGDVLTELGSNVFVLADPDLMNNAGLADPNVAHAALDAIEDISPDSRTVIFDMTAHVAGKQKYSLMKLMLEPPFLALTLTIIFAAALAVLNGLGRFGPPRVPQRVFAYGKKSLVDMTALMMRRGGKLGGLAPGYAALVRSRAGEALGAPPNLSTEALDHWLEDTDRAGQGDWRNLVAASAEAHNPQAVKSIAKRLYDWKARRISER